MHGLEESDKQKIIGLITVLLPNAKIYLFGSRARGNYTEQSDIDLALNAGKPIPPLILGEIASVLEATNIVNSIDVVDLCGSLSQTMRESILKHGIIWKA